MGQELHPRVAGEPAGKGGVWIDHREAIVVVLDSDSERPVHVASHVVKHLSRGGDSPLKGPFEVRQVPRDDRRQMALTGELNAYYDQVMAMVAQLDALLILGPGEAKGEFKTRLDRHKLGARVVEVKTADKMTDPQLAAKVREYFNESAAQVRS
jgi:hypothetical protein